jgi:hemoglobin
VTVYERLGGDAGVTRLLDELYRRALADPLFVPFFQNIDLERFKSRQHAFVSQAVGGPQQYAGPPLVQSHAHLRIEQRHFDGFIEHLRCALQDIGAPDDLTALLLDQVRPLGVVIVNASSAAAGDPR